MRIAWNWVTIALVLRPAPTNCRGRVVSAVQRERECNVSQLAGLEEV